MSWRHLNDTKPKARKPYPCFLCNRVIDAGTEIGDYIVQCIVCGRCSSPGECESEALAIHRWNSDFLWGDDFED